ncbi:polysaccharide pyruvyl transferase family protein [Asticcacaulis sp. AC402]|uniref:polysaccharide pyruvyl transferase family protein n=1 Tax=Asticcacaulis sp. AC402 TaxID=1282361 RepID=UPI0003C3DC8A|nr:polysaccharide pyruvyl transferase family protein [Asticcacaulis sp. AC402]ESQ73894.1 hypothetical protein ABAC402_16735 [Asticcacaulis sp. AC402]
MNKTKRVGIIDNLADIRSFKELEAFEPVTKRYSAAVGGNTGNLAFVMGTKLSLGNRYAVTAWHENPDRVRQHFDHLVICCANQIGKHADLKGWGDRLDLFGLPVTLVGLGAQTTNYETEIEIPEGTRHFLSVVGKLNDSSQSNIGVRGDYTRGVLADIGFDSFVTGCPSLFISPDQTLGESIAAAEVSDTDAKIAVAAGNPYHPQTRALEGNLVDIVTATHGAYVIQHPDIMISLATGQFTEDDESKLPNVLEAYGGRFGSVEEMVRWFGRHAFAFYDGYSWIDFLRHYDAAIGPRYHGVAFAVQAKRPGLVVHIDNRTRELSVTTGIKSMAATDFKNVSVDEALRLVTWSREEGLAFDENRRMRADGLAKFLIDNNLSASDRLLSLA